MALIQNALVFDGSGNPPEQLDIAIKKGRVVARGSTLPRTPAAEVIDAEGKWLMPGLLHGVFGPGFDEEDKNKLIEAAKQHASGQARELVERMTSEVHSSARQTLEALARGFGATRVEFDFQEAELVEGKIEYDSSRASGESAA